MTLCVLQQPPHHTENGYICTPHRRPLPDILDDIARIYPLLELELGTAGSDPHVTGSREAPLPLSVDVLDLTAEARTGALTPIGRELARRGDQIGYLSAATTLDTWVRDWRDLRDRSEGPPEPTVPVLATWLRVRLDWAADCHSAVDEFVVDIRNLRGVLKALAGERPPKPKRLVAPCIGCGQLAMFRVPGEDYAVECRNPDCERIYTEAEYEQLTKIEAAYQSRLETVG